MKRYHPQAEAAKKKRRLPAWAVTPTFILGVVIVVLALILAFFPGQIAPYDPTAVDITARSKAPSAQHLFGTDNYGRDIFSRVVWGTRIDLSIGFFGVIVPLIVGGIIGLLAAWYGGWLDSLLMRVSEIMMAFPFTILVIAIITILGTGTINLYIALWLVGWMSYARLVRAEVLTLKKAEFIEAARVAGFSDARILLRHVLPNVISSSIVFAASDMVMCMLTGASMSFLGLGVQPPTPEWGAILNEGRTYITYAAWMTFFPGLVLAVTGVGLSLLGDSMTDILRRKGR
ncbi:MAG: ABC transporter permease [Clostridia bacterium]|nr:ABC transporter permease [Clostridia bacterium]